MPKRNLSEMMLFSRCVGLGTGCVLLLALGCSGSNTGQAVPGQETRVLLQEVNDLLHTAAGGRAPTKLADLQRQEQNFPKGYAAVKSGEVVVLWGTPPQGEGQVGSNETVLAYEKAVPKDGGFVLLSAGTVKKMTPDEFNAAPKAGKK
jgi:hypothetical protein